MRGFFAIIAALFLCSCSTGQGGGGTPMPEPDAKPPFGWRGAGLVPNLDSLNKWGTGFAEITHSKDYIFVMDSRVSDLQTLKPTAYRIFM